MEQETKPREEGYYWVMLDEGDEWSIEQWLGNCWVAAGCLFVDEEPFFKIGERILPPEN